MDNLKKINDVYGHMAGDRALRNLGTLLSRYTANGIACRLGGDEFLLFLPDISAENVSKLTTRLFHHFHSIAEADPEIKDAALSAGLYMCTTSDTFADCYSKADKALYNVKQNGKITFPFIIRSVIPLPIHQVLPGIFSRWQTRFAKVAAMQVLLN